jgi:superfamily II DNA/RNA helicase
LIVRRLRQRGWEHVLFHGGVPGEKRGALVDRFNSDPACRLFLSTDAGGVGLNLQHAAAVVINMDLPWNPAVLEQRIGRVHRLGQTRGVQVINFVARGTIEEGMLSVLAFKQSLFAGILDGGESEIVLQGTRLSKFMETVEQVSSAAQSETPVYAEGQDSSPLDATTESGTAPDSGEEYRQSEPPSEAVETAAGEPRPTPSATATAETLSPAAATLPVAADPWAPLLTAGMQLLGELARASSDESESPWVQTDSATGQRYLKLPVPDPQTVQRLAEGLLGLLGGRR